MNISILAILLVLLQLYSSSINATIYYVDNQSGNNKNNGRKDKPWFTIKHSLNKLRNGDTLVLKDNGRNLPYREPIKLKKPINITFTSLFSDSKPVISGADDWSQGNKYFWIESKGLWILKTKIIPDELFMASAVMWEKYGIDSLHKKRKTENLINPGEWVYNKGLLQIEYKPETKEKINATHIEAVLRPSNIKINTGQNIIINNLSLQFAKNTALLVKGESSNITIKNTDVFYAGDAAIKVVGGGHNIKILDCTINYTGNNGILFKGHKKKHVETTLVSGCMITNVLSNDCITYHKDKDYNDVGNNHVIKNNIVGKCAEQGIDITSGSNFLLAGNTTYENGLSGIVIGHNANNVEIRDHLSINNGKRGEILVKKSNNVKFIDSIAIGKGTLVDLDGNNNFTSKNNVLINMSKQNFPCIKISKKTINSIFEKNNVIVVETENNSPLVSIMELGKNTDFISMFDNNIWWSPHGEKTKITAAEGMLLSTINELYRNRVKEPQHSIDMKKLYKLVSKQSFNEIRNILRKLILK